MTDHPGQEFLDEIPKREVERKAAEAERERRLEAEAKARRERERQNP